VALRLHVGLLGDKAQRPAGLQNALIYFGQRSEPLSAGRGLQLGHGNEFPFQMVHANRAALDQNVSFPFDNLVELLVLVEKANDQIIDAEQRGSPEQASGKRIVVAYDGILHRVGKGHQHNQIEGIQLHQLALSRKPQHHHEKYIDDDRPEDFL
jgi:hypothetical protein